MCYQIECSQRGNSLVKICSIKDSFPMPDQLMMQPSSWKISSSPCQTSYSCTIYQDPHARIVIHVLTNWDNLSQGQSDINAINWTPCQTSYSCTLYQDPHARIVIHVLYINWTPCQTRYSCTLYQAPHARLVIHVLNIKLPIPDQLFMYST